MNLLFVDTETTGLNCNEHQIIEIAGALATFDPVSFSLSGIQTFDSTVTLRQALDPKITRITGISEQELAQARDITSVQLDWARWLDSHNIDAIIGHSIDFDIGFLRKEGWAIPSCPVIDTLPITKIAYPYISAVNLEHILFSRKIDPAMMFPGQLSDSTSSAHRALFDTLACGAVFVDAIKSIDAICAPGTFFEMIRTHFIPLPITFYPKPLPDKPAPTYSEVAPQHPITI